MHLIDLKNGFMGTSAIVGSSISLAVGMALHLNLKNSRNISIIFRRGGKRGGYFFRVN